MSWTITASGHCPDATYEARLLEQATEMLIDADFGLTEMHLHAEWYGDVKLTVDSRYGQKLDKP